MLNTPLRPIVNQRSYEVQMNQVPQVLRVTVGLSFTVVLFLFFLNQVVVCYKACRSRGTDRRPLGGFLDIDSGFCGV